MIDALFGSKTRIKLLHLFMNNPGQAFYVREITRLIDEQINSVRRELANLLEAGVITSASADNKLYYKVNQSYEHYVPFRSIFTPEKVGVSLPKGPSVDEPDWRRALRELRGVRIVVLAGVLVRSSVSPVDLLVVGEVSLEKMKDLVKLIEVGEKRELTYSAMKYDEFYYRLSVRDKFISGIMTNKHEVLLDTDNILKER